MRTLIIFQSKHGTTEKSVRILADSLKDKPEFLRLSKSKVNLTPFDTVIIGASVHAGNIQRDIKKFCRHYENELLTKKLGVFLCSAETGEKGEQQYISNFPEKLRQHVSAFGLFGGEYLLDKMNFLEKGIIKKIANIAENQSMVQPDKILQFAKKIEAE